MSAIAGILGHAAPEDVIQKILKAMCRRGPKGKVLYQDKNACILQGNENADTVFASLDWGEERYTLALDGTLFNAEQIRQALQLLGHHLQGSEDAELLLHAYAQWKRGALEKLNGVFTFAVWEEKSGTLFLARDRIGV